VSVIVQLVSSQSELQVTREGRKQSTKEYRRSACEDLKCDLEDSVCAVVQ
jgi:hypothetical protein